MDIQVSGFKKVNEQAMPLEALYNQSAIISKKKPLTPPTIA
jgi:hypothetical protein